jgi:hypothetical protein
MDRHLTFACSGLQLGDAHRAAVFTSGSHVFPNDSVVPIEFSFNPIANSRVKMLQEITWGSYFAITLPELLGHYLFESFRAFVVGQFCRSGICFLPLALCLAIFPSPSSFVTRMWGVVCVILNAIMVSRLSRGI